MRDVSEGFRFVNTITRPNDICLPQAHLVLRKVRMTDAMRTVTRRRLNSVHAGSRSEQICRLQRTDNCLLALHCTVRHVHTVHFMGHVGVRAASLKNDIMAVGAQPAHPWTKCSSH